MDPLTAAGLLLGGGIAFTITIVLIDAFIREPYYAIYGLLIAYMGDIIFDAQIQMTFSGITLTLYDVTAVFLTGAALARLLRRRGHDLGRALMVVILLGSMAVLSLVRGLLEFGVQVSVNEFREWFHYLSAVMYFATVPFDRLQERKCVKALTYASTVMFVLVLARWAAKYGGLPIGPFDLGVRAASRVYGEGSSPRVIHANDTFLILQVAIIHFSRWRTDVNRRHLRHASIAFAFVLALQHRTVWIAMILVMGLLTIKNRQLAGRLAVFGAVVMVIGIGGVLATAGADGLSRTAESDRVEVQLGQGALAGNTFVWRFEGWTSLITQVDYSNPVEVGFGAPYGNGWERMIRGHLVFVSPHSAYVTSYMRMGAVGLLLFVTMLGGAILRLQRRDWVRELLPDHVLMCLVSAQAVFLISYDPDQVQGMVLGLALGSLANRQRTQYGSTSGRRDLRAGVRPNLGVIGLAQSRGPVPGTSTGTGEDGGSGPKGTLRT